MIVIKHYLATNASMLASNIFNIFFKISLTTYRAFCYHKIY